MSIPLSLSLVIFLKCSFKNLNIIENYLKFETTKVPFISVYAIHIKFQLVYFFIKWKKRAIS